MGKWFKHLIFLIVCVTFTGCGMGNNEGSENNKKADVPMGRYVEESAGLDDVIKDEGDANFWTDNQGKLQVLVQNESLINYELEDSGEWKQTDLELCKIINEEHPEIVNIEYITQSQKGTYYLLGDKRVEGKEQVFVATFENSEFKEIEMEWQEEKPIILGMAVDQNENIMICDHVDPCVEIFSSDGKLKTKLGDEAMKPVLLGDKIVGVGQDKVEVYDGATYVKEKTIEGISCNPRNVTIFSDNENTAFIATSAGIFRLSKDSDIFEKIVEGALCSLSAYDVHDAMFYKDEIYMLYSMSDKHMNHQQMVKKLVYHEEVPTVATNEITIWSVTKSRILADAIKAYKKQHPDTCVNFEILYNNEQFSNQYGDVKSEDLEALSTQLLAGEGPDIIVLDGLPIESYRKQGIFSDLTACLEKSSNENELLNNLVTSYGQDGKIDAIPLEFSLITAIGQKELLKDGFKLKDISAYQENHPDERIMSPIISSTRVRLMADYLQNELFNQDGKVNTEMMADYLKMIKSVEPEGDALISREWRNTYEAEGSILGNISKVDIEKATSLYSLQTMAHILHEVPDTMITDQIEEEKNMVQGCQLVAINQNSENKEIAEDIIRTALSEEVQGGDCNDGLPVNVEALEEKLLYNDHRRMNLMFYAEIKELEDGTLDFQPNRFEFGYPEEMKFFLEQCKKAEPIKPLDETIRTIMKQETEEYFKGNMSLEETVSNLEKKINLYISEQGK